MAKIQYSRVRIGALYNFTHGMLPIRLRTAVSCRVADSSRVFDLTGDLQALANGIPTCRAGAATSSRMGRPGARIALSGRAGGIFLSRGADDAGGGGVHRGVAGAGRGQ